MFKLSISASSIYSGIKSTKYFAGSSFHDNLFSFMFLVRCSYTIYTKKISLNEEYDTTFNSAIGSLKAGDFSKAHKQFDTALKLYLANKGELDENVAYLYVQKGVAAFKNKQIQEAEKCFSEAERSIKSLTDVDPNLISYLYTNMETLFSSGKDIDRAIYYAKQALDMQNKVPNNDKENFVNINLRIAELLHAKARNYQDSLPYYQACETEIANGTKVDPSNLCSIYEGLGHSYFEKGDYQKALEYYTKVEESGKASPKNMGLVYLNMGVCSLEIMNFEKAKTELDKALSLCTKHFGENSDQVASVYSILGTLEFSRKRYQYIIFADVQWLQRHDNTITSQLILNIPLNL